MKNKIKTFQIIEEIPNKKWSAMSSNGNNLASIDIYKNNFHPNNLYFNLTHFESNNFFEVNHALINKVTEISKLPLQFSTMSNQTQLIELLQMNHFVKKRQCWEFSITLKDISKFIKDNNTFMSISNFKMANCQTIKELQTLIVNIYKETHKEVNAVDEQLTVEECYQILCGSISLSDSYYYKTNESLYFCCIEKNNADSVFVTYFGYSGNSKNYTNFLKTVFAKLFLKYETLYFEVDDINPYAMIINGFYPFTNQTSYDTYVLSH